MAKSFEFTDKYLTGKDCQPKEKQFYVRENHGFAIRVLPSGVITFLYIYTLNGNRRQMNLGSFSRNSSPDARKASLAEARRAHRDAANLVARGADPQEMPEPEVIPAVLTLEGLINKYKEHIKGHLVQRSVVQLTRTLEHDILPAWRNRPAAEIRRPEAIALIETIAKRAPGQARNVIKTARAMYTFGIERGHAEVNPFMGVMRAVPVTAPRSRARVLNDAEVETVWEILKSSEIGRAILLILVTAQRPGEVAGMQWGEIDGEWWEIPGERTKTGNCNRVYLTDLAISLLPKKIDAQYVFPANGRGRGVGATGNMRPATMSHLLTDNNYLGFERWTPHDLRRTARTGLSRLGVIERHAEEVLNHSKSGVMGTYDRYLYDPEKKAALEKWGAHLEKIISREAP
jgi:integrase